jgi:hypothetical protein
MAVNGRRLDSGEAVTRTFRAFRAGIPLQATVQRQGGESVVVVTPADALRQPVVVLILLLNLATGLAFAAVGGFVYWKRPADPRALLFFVMCSAFGLVRLINAGPYHSYGFAPGTNLFAVVLLVVSVFLLFPLLVHFCLVFPRRRPILSRYPAILQWMYGVPAAQAVLLLVLLAVTLLLLDVRPEDANNPVFRWIQSALRPLAAQRTALFSVLALALALPALRIAGSLRTCRLSGNGWRAILLGNPRLSLTAGLVLPLFVFVLLEAALNLLGAARYERVLTFCFLAVAGLEFTAAVLTQWVVFPVAACLAFYRSYREAALDERRQVRWPLWGLLAAVSFDLLSTPAALVVIALLRLPINTVAHAAVFYTAQSVEVVCLMLIPLSFAFAILKYRLMEIDVYIRRTAIYGGVIGLLGLIYVVLVGGLGTVISRFAGVQSDLLTAGSTLAVALAFVPVRNRVRSAVDERFFRRRDYAASLAALGRDIALARDEEALARIAADGVERALHCRSVAVRLRRAGGQVAVVEAGSGPYVEQAAIGDHGAIRAGSRLSDEIYDEHDREFLAAAARLVVTAQENLRMRAEQRELERASEIQRALLPSALPQISGVEIAAAWQPARSVSGDYYDVIDLGEERYGVLIADVSGKGLPAALLMSNLQAAVKAFAPQCDGAATLCDRVNRLICANVTAGRFVTFFYAVLHAAERRLVYSNAGHNAPVLCRR